MTAGNSSSSEGPSAGQAPRRGRSAPPPSEAWRYFGIEELFFSTTDDKGIILAGNHVFERVSAYSRAELIGAPHNLIRHPDMPRCVFKLLWDEIGAGRIIAAYVKNLAKDGKYYWVLATVVPVTGGYLSVRLKPSTAYFQAAQKLYPELLALEREVEAGNPRNRKQAMESSTARLGELLRGAGFPSYEAFMHAALPAELHARDAALGAGVRSRLGTPPAAVAGGAVLVPLLSQFAAVSDFLESIAVRLDTYAALHTQLAQKAQFVLDLADDVGLFSLNALLASTRMQQAGQSLGAVAAIMRSRSDADREVFGGLTEAMTAVMELLGNMVFPTATTKLQTEVALVFVRELLEGKAELAGAAASLAALAEGMAAGLDQLVTALTGLDRAMAGLSQHAGRLQADLNIMRALEVNGRIEAARAQASEAVAGLFVTIGEQVRRARQEMVALSAMRTASFAADASAATQVRARVTDIQRRLATLAAA